MVRHHRPTAMQVACRLYMVMRAEGEREEREELQAQQQQQEEAPALPRKPVRVLRIR